VIAGAGASRRETNCFCYNNTFINHHHQHHKDDNDHEEKNEKNKNLKTSNGAFGRAVRLFLSEDEYSCRRAITSRLSSLGAATAATDVSSSSWSSWTTFDTMTCNGDVDGGADHQLSQPRRLFESKLPKLQSI
jgi:hypothetical protein